MLSIYRQYPEYKPFPKPKILEFFSNYQYDSLIYIYLKNFEYYVFSEFAK